MIIQIIRTVLIGAVIYFFSKVARNLIDQKLDNTKNLNNQERSQDRQTINMPEKLTPCPNCNIYYNQNHPPVCGKDNCPLKSGE